MISSSYLSGNTAIVTWQAVSGATSYNVKRSTTSGGPYTTVTTNNFYYFETISVPTYYLISGVNSSGEGKASPEVLIFTPVTAAELTAPQFILANQQATVSLATTVSGRTYQLQRSYTLDSGSWVNLSSAKAGGGALDFSDAIDSTKKAAFYRIEIGP